MKVYVVNWAADYEGEQTEAVYRDLADAWQHVLRERARSRYRPQLTGEPRVGYIRANGESMGPVIHEMEVL
jgi:hypothetical protein